ncbi:hypothetical protein CC80DRAFT_363402, partial [Byssothecium circinans]
NVPALTTIFIPPSNCVDRWMLDEINEIVSSKSTFTNVEQLTVAPTYSPGVCPDGHTVAEVTEHQVGGSSGNIDRYRQASCCKRYISSESPCNKKLKNNMVSGLTFGPKTRALCYSSVSTPLISTSTYKIVSMLSQGIAVADPVIVGWQMHDLTAFPSAYASSPAQKIGVSLAMSTAALPGSSLSTPLATAPPRNTYIGETPSPPRSNTGALVGIAVGSIIGRALLGAISIILLIRQRNSKKA